jgi:hypothetical protein
VCWAAVGCGVLDELQGRLESLSVDDMVSMLVLSAWYGSSTDVDSFLRKYGLYCINMCMRPQGLNALHVAVIMDKPDMVRLLLSASANPLQAAEDDGFTPLLLACRHQVRGPGCSHLGLPVLVRGCSVFHVTDSPRSGCCVPLIQREEIAGLLLASVLAIGQLEAALTAVDAHFGMSPLMWACLSNNKQVGGGTWVLQCCASTTYLCDCAVADGKGACCVTELCWPCCHCRPNQIICAIADAVSATNHGIVVLRRILTARSSFLLTPCMLLCQAAPSRNWRYAADVTDGVGGPSAGPTPLPSPRPAHRVVSKVVVGGGAEPKDGDEDGCRAVRPFGTPLQGVESPALPSREAPGGQDPSANPDSGRYLALLATASECLSELLGWLDTGEERLNLLRSVDVVRWSSFHYAARCGWLLRVLFAFPARAVASAPVATF